MVKELAEKKLEGMLRAAGLPKKASYAPGEVQAILGCSESTYWRLLARAERDPASSQLKHPDCLDSFMLQRTRRVRFDELVDYLTRNNTYERNHGIDPRQMALFDGYDSKAS
jgi:hypothetical protein